MIEERHAHEYDCSAGNNAQREGPRAYMRQATRMTVLKRMADSNMHMETTDLWVIRLMVAIVWALIDGLLLMLMCV